MSKAQRRARKKELRRQRRAHEDQVVTCDGCGFQRPDNGGDHDTAWSANGVTWDGVAVVAFCEWCGCDTCT